MSTPASPERSWQAGFLALLPEIERRARFTLRRLPPNERDEAQQAILAGAAVAYARLAQQGRTALAFAGPLVRYGYAQYRAGRLVGDRANARDVGSPRWRKVSGRRVESPADWQETLALADQRRGDPAEIAALRIDFTDWLQTLAPRDRQLTHHLARGEQTRRVARMFRLSAGRVSQLRRELHDSWQRFCGEPAATGC